MSIALHPSTPGHTQLMAAASLAFVSGLLEGFCFVLKSASHCVTQAGLTVKILLLSPPKSWDFRSEPPCPASCQFLTIPSPSPSAMAIRSLVLAQPSVLSLCLSCIFINNTCSHLSACSHLLWEPTCLFIFICIILRQATLVSQMPLSHSARQTMIP